MKVTKVLLLLAATVFLAVGSAQAGVSFTIGKGDFYLSVGDYDYLPYSDYRYPSYGTPRIRFYDVMSDYGSWVYAAPFGQVWRPYVSYDWRPYVYGHWVYTRYGPTWQGYEPWAWAGYHYGNWIWTQRHGWVWIPGYQWHPGRVVWSFGYGTIGWMPAPPSGYDYQYGYLDRYHDRYDDDYRYGDDYDRYDPYGYDDRYYSSRYAGVAPHLWIFININHFGHDNYSGYYLDRDYVRYMFDRRIVQVHRSTLRRDTIERIVKQKVVEVPVVERQFDTDRERIKVVVPQGEEEKIRRHANIVVREAIAPGFAEKQKAFKGLQAKNQKVVSRVFRQENVKPVVESINSEVLVKKVQEEKKQKEARRQENVRTQLDEVKRSERDGKVQEWKQKIQREAGVKEDDRGRKSRFDENEDEVVRRKDDEVDEPGSKQANPRSIEPYKPREREKQDRDEQFESKPRSERSNDRKWDDEEVEEPRGGSVKRKQAKEYEAETETETETEVEGEVEAEVEEETELKNKDSDSEKSKSKSKSSKKKKSSKDSDEEELKDEKKRKKEYKE